MSRTTYSLGLATALLAFSLFVAVGRVSSWRPDWSAVCQGLSLHDLPEADRRLAEFLVLIPPSALIICVFRHVVGWATFGTFSPALLGLAFRQPESWPGLPLFLGLLLGGWAVRHLLEPLHLLHVPRVSTMLSGLAATLLVLVVQASRFGWPVAEYVHLFPLVILTGIVERMWHASAEEGAGSSFRTLLATVAAAALVGWVTGRAVVVEWLLHFPETLAAIVAGQVALGRYTGLRWSEWLRFRMLSRPGGDALPTGMAKAKEAISSPALRSPHLPASLISSVPFAEREPWPFADGLP
ncbi:MAG: hypothetical protein N2039_03510 [Gemmataceae bacterium]|nr:hypothetical protein [Gemmataceae bacterium]